MDHKCQSAQFQVVCVLYRTFWLKMSLCAACQKCSIHKPSLVCRSMVILSPYSFCVVASVHQNLDVQIWNATTRIHPELMSEMKLANQRCNFLLVEELKCFFTLYLECSSWVCLPFHVGDYSQWKQAISCHWHFYYQLAAWTNLFNHIAIIFYIDSVAFLNQFSNAQKIMF